MTLCYQVIGTPEQRAAKTKALLAETTAGGHGFKKQNLPRPSEHGKGKSGGSADTNVVNLLMHTDARSKHAVILDSGAQMSVVREKLLLDNYTEDVQGAKITAANGSTLKILGYGSVTVRDPAYSDKWVTWNKVYHCADICRNVLSIAPLTSMGLEVRVGSNPRHS